MMVLSHVLRVCNVTILAIEKMTTSSTAIRKNIRTILQKKNAISKRNTDLTVNVVENIDIQAAYHATKYDAHSSLMI